jgi:hypothetical protein
MVIRHLLDENGGCETQAILLGESPAQPAVPETAGEPLTGYDTS